MTPEDTRRHTGGDKGLGRFHGVVPAMATPFTETGELDEARVASLIDWYLAAGVHGISVAGSQGEFFAMNDVEIDYSSKSRCERLTVAYHSTPARAG